jgi:hypothetical protein
LFYSKEEREREKVVEEEALFVISKVKLREANRRERNIDAQMLQVRN